MNAEISSMAVLYYKKAVKLGYKDLRRAARELPCEVYAGYN